MAELPVILHEDDHVVVFDKPSGLPVAPDRWDKGRPHLMGLVHARLSPRIYNAHRLDADTSGIVLCAKTKHALDRLCAQFERGDVEKEYFALVRGRPARQRGEIREPLMPDLHRPGEMRASRVGKPAHTDYEIERIFRGFALLRLRPRTGRTHQLRVHMRCIGCPIVADPWYGDGRPLFLSEFKRGYKPARGEERPLLARLALHAHRLAFEHPATGARVAIEAPVPDDLAVALKQLAKWAA
jgi:RluA family pseudouridine synthase